MNVDDGLKYIRWIRSLGGDELPAAFYALVPNLEKRSIFYFLLSERDRDFFVACFLHSSAQMCLYQTPGRRPPRMTGRFVNTVARGWVGAPNERAPLRLMAQSLVLSIHVCRGLGILPVRINIWLSFSHTDLGPTSAQDFFFSFSSKFGTFFFEVLCS